MFDNSFPTCSFSFGGAPALFLFGGGGDSQDSLLVRLRALDLGLKGSKFEPRLKQQENFLLQRQLCVLTLIQCPFHPHVTAVACKRPRSFCQKNTGGRLQLNMHTPFTKWSQSGPTIPLSRQSMGTYQKMSSQATHQGTLGHSHLSSLSHYGLILA